VLYYNILVNFLVFFYGFFLACLRGYNKINIRPLAPPRGYPRIPVDNLCTPWGLSTGYTQVPHRLYTGSPQAHQSGARVIHRIFTRGHMH